MRLLPLFALVAPSFQGAVLRFGCSQIVIDRIDPLVNPGQSPSPHIHQIVGGDAFAPEIPSSDVSKLASCTTCSFSEDFSNYWTANLYFQARNGSYKRVPQIPNRFLDGAEQGVTVYYVAPYDGAKATAFQPGFRMLVGDVANREPEGMTRMNCFRCYNDTDFGGDLMAPCSDPGVDSIHLPEVPCPGGIRSNVEFPTCWDGINLDSEDHKSHVVFPADGTFQDSAECPETHPVKLPQLFLEVVWDTRQFNDPELWPEDGSQPFVFSYGDRTGHGQHADYVFGWKDDSLQRAMDVEEGCFGASCHELESQVYEVANNCSVAPVVDEDFDGCEYPRARPDFGMGADGQGLQELPSST